MAGKKSMSDGSGTLRAKHGLATLAAAVLAAPLAIGPADPAAQSSTETAAAGSMRLAASNRAIAEDPKGTKKRKKRVIDTKR